MKIRWTKGASENLKNIEEFIGKDDPRAAIEMILKVIHSVGQLAGYPAMGRPGRIEGTKELVVSGTPFIVPYRVKNETVQILKVLHHSQKWP